MAAFAGLPKDFFRFFVDLATHNERPWFEENKDRYKQSVVESASALITALQPRLAKISKLLIADPRPNGGSMFRIYRDVRFGRDKRPYKDHAGIQFRHRDGKTAHAPGFYIHLSPDEVFFGGGAWMPEPEALLRIRRAIANDPAAWKKLIGHPAFKKQFPAGVGGEALQRPPKGFDPAHPLIETLKQKSFHTMHKSSVREAQSAGFVDAIDDALKAAAPFMKFLCTAVGAPF